VDGTTTEHSAITRRSFIFTENCKTAKRFEAIYKESKLGDLFEVLNNV